MPQRGPCGEVVGAYTEVEERPAVFNGRQVPGVYIRQLLGEDVTPTFAMRVFRLEPGARIPRHKHPWEHLQFILEGAGVFTIGDVAYRVKPGYFVYIPPNAEHEYYNDGEEDLIFLCMVPHKPSVPEDYDPCR